MDIEGTGCYILAWKPSSKYISNLYYKPNPMILLYFLELLYGNQSKLCTEKHKKICHAAPEVGEEVNKEWPV